MKLLKVLKIKVCYCLKMLRIEKFMNMYNARRKMVPPLPKTMKELQKAISNLDLKTERNEQFLLINDPNCHIIIFSCGTNLKVICLQSEIIYTYVTFEYCPKLFTQLFSMHGLCNDYYYISLLFTLLPDKKNFNPRQFI